MESQLRADTVGLSGKSANQLARMLDDFAFLTYPLHFLVNMIKSLLFMILLMAAAVFYLSEWACVAHNDRADLIQNFNREQTVYRYNTANATISVAKAGEFAVDKDTFASVFTGCNGTDSSLKHTTWFDHNWLAEKSDMFQAAYIVASRNMAALRSTLGQVRGNKEISFNYACLDGTIYGQGVVIPNAPVVNVAFLRRTDRDLEEPANAKYNYFTGMCLASAKCTAADYSPRNDNIYADAVYHQVTPNQARALKALCDTGTPEFWVAAAHANGIYNDALIASYARKNQIELASALQHLPTPEEEFLSEMEITGLGSVTFIALIALWIARRTCCGRHVNRLGAHKSVDSTELRGLIYRSQG